jgi:uncharacterized protein (DUF2141 family)
MTKTRFAFRRFNQILLLCCALLTVLAGVLTAQAPANATQAPSKSTLTIKITSFRNAKGRVSIALFRDAKGFPSDIASAVVSHSCEIDSKTMSATVVFKDLPQGVYAASLFHDENLTGKMDFNDQGIPQNGYGISNNPDTNFGPPTPEQASFKVNQPELSIEIKMVYWQ